MSRKIVELNDHQSKAVRHVWGACYVNACPGSGKTRVIVERCARLIEEEIPPRSILCITFTNKAAEEMKHRLAAMIGEKSKELYISTFHALCAEILRKYGTHIGYLPNITIVKEDDQESLMAQCARSLNYDLKPQEVKKLIWAVNSAREKLFAPDSSDFDNEFMSAKFGADIARDYILKLRQNNQVDFSGLLSEAIRLLETQKHVLQKLQDRFTMIQVDEAQDTNLAQFKIVQLLGEHTNVFMVGDLDQSIYGWRGARFENITDFVEKFNAEQIHLPVNYRSSQAIVEAAGRLIKANKNRPNMDFQTVNEPGDPIVCRSFGDPDIEARWISEEIREMVISGNYKPSDFAILYRNNSMSRALEVAMMEAGVDCEVIGSFGFFDRKEIKDILSMLRFLANPKDGLALARFINKPSRRIGQTTIAKIEAFATSQKIDLVQALSRAKEYIKGADALRIQTECENIAKTFSESTKDVPLGDIMERIVTSMDYLRYLQEDDDASYFNRKQNLDELFTSASIYSSKKPNDIIGYLNKIALQSSSDKKTPDGAVTMMTIHASKGLEFPVVFMPCADEGSLPSSMAINDRDKDAEEERRLCYVGMTRAKKKLYMSYPKFRQKRNNQGFIVNVPTKPSRFFQEAGLKIYA